MFAVVEAVLSPRAVPCPPMVAAPQDTEGAPPAPVPAPVPLPPEPEQTEPEEAQGTILEQTIAKITKVLQEDRAFTAPELAAAINDTSGWRTKNALFFMKRSGKVFLHGARRLAVWGRTQALADQGSPNTSVARLRALMMATSRPLTVKYVAARLSMSREHVQYLLRTLRDRGEVQGKGRGMGATWWWASPPAAPSSEGVDAAPAPMILGVAGEGSDDVGTSPPSPSPSPELPPSCGDVLADRKADEVLSAPSAPPPVVSLTDVEMRRELVAARLGQLTYEDIAGEREHALVRHYQAGNRDAGEVLLAAHRGAIWQAVHRHCRGSHDLELEDLYSEAQAGFLVGVSKYDFRPEAKLLTYAMWWIRHRIQRAKLEQGSTIYVPPNIVEQPKMSDGREKRGVQAMRAARNVVRLDEMIGEEGTSSLLDMLPDEGPLPDGDLLTASSQKSMKVLLDHAQLTKQERLVVERRFLAEETETLKEIGDAVGLTRERIRQIEATALDKLRRAARRERLDVYQLSA